MSGSTSGPTKSETTGSGKEKTEIPNSCPWELLLGFCAIILTIIDVGSDIVLVASYFVNGHMTYFGLTLTFIVLSAVIICIIINSNVLSDAKPLVESKIINYLRLIFSFCYLGQLGLLLEALCYEWKISRREESERKAEQNVTKRYKFIKLMGLVEALFESIPQLLLQLYVIIRHMQVIRLEFSTGFHPGIPEMDLNITSNEHILKSEDAILENAIQRAYFNVTEEELNQQLWKRQITTLGIFQVVSIVSSLGSVAWALTSYIRYDYKSTHKYKESMSWTNCIIHFLWRLFQISSRVFAFSLFSSAFTFWCAIPLIFRLIYIYLLIIRLKIATSSEKRQIICIVLLFPFTFFYLNYDGDKSKNGNDKKRVTFGQASYMYFVYRIIEDTCLVTLWCRVVHPVFTWFYYWSIGIHVGGIILDFVFMFIYLKRIEVP